MTLPAAEKIWTGAEVLAATGADRLAGDPKTGFDGISIDSRTIGSGSLFVAIRGDVHDGHNFAAEVIERGCRGVLVAADRVPALPVRQWSDRGVFCAAARDTRRALGDLAAFHRRRTASQVVAITGSNGKTSTREMTVAVFSRRYRTLGPAGNFNNDIGVPLTLFRLRPDTPWAVLELGMNHPGEIARLTDICDPDVGVITNIGPAHLEGVGSMEGVMAAKGELLDHMGPDRWAVLNADDERVRKLASRTSQNVLLYGTDPSAPLRAEKIRPEGLCLRFDLVMGSYRMPIALQTPARFMVLNALAAAGAAHLCGLSLEEIQAGLQSFRPVPGRMNVLETARGVTVIDDTYNANPGSMAGVIETLTGAGSGRRLLVVGDMRELGEKSADLHRELGQKAAGAGLYRLYATGDMADEVARGARSGGMALDSIVCAPKSEILSDLENRLHSGDWIAVKGSRAMGMEEIVRELLAQLNR